MDEYFMNAGVPPALHFEPASSSTPHALSIPTSLHSSLSEMYCSSEQSSDCFLNLNWDKPADQQTQFESAFSSMVSSPAASNSAVSNDAFAIRELIGKLGTVFKSGEPFPAYFGGRANSTANSSYCTPLNSPPKMPLPVVDQLPGFGNHSMALNSSPLPSLSTDPGFAERAAKFSCFGSRSSNGRTGLPSSNGSELQYGSSTIPLMCGGKLGRVSSSPLLNAGGSPNKNSGSPPQAQRQMKPANGLGSFPGRLLSESAANSNEESSVSEQNPSGDKGPKIPTEPNSRKRKAFSRGKAKEESIVQSANVKREEVENNANAKRPRASEDNCGSQNNSRNAEEKKGSTNGGGSDQSKKKGKASPKPPEPPKDYIHVRARRGQATDSHSLAERVRREKISQRMKLLQDLVPGCNKVTGKALMLDEIINYVRSLQRQVEFLSMKLASINPRMSFDKEEILSNDVFQPKSPLTHSLHPMDSSALALYGRPRLLSPQVPPNVSDESVSQSPLDPFDASLCCNVRMQLPHPNGYGECIPQLPAFAEDDLHSIIQMGFSHTPKEESPFHSQSFLVDNQTSNMNVDA